MEFIDGIRKLGDRAFQFKDVLQNEEVTKTTLIMPFIGLLGYDVSHPYEVVPEYTADVGIKKGEKVDYALFKDGSPVIFVECKSAGVDLDNGHADQLYRYFSVVKDVRFGVLTNGLLYRFFSDIESENCLDETPFLELDLLDIQRSLVDDVERFSRGKFDVDGVLGMARELKYVREIKSILAKECESPSDDFVRFCISDVYSGQKKQSVIDQFVPRVKRAFTELISENGDFDRRLGLRGGKKDKESNEKESNERAVGKSCEVVQPSKKSKKKRLASPLVVIWGDDVIRGKTAKDTFVHVLKRMGLKRVFDVCHEHGIVLAGMPVVSPDLDSLEEREREGVVQDGEYLIQTHSNTKTKAEKICQIAEILEISLRYEIREREREDKDGE